MIVVHLQVHPTLGSVPEVKGEPERRIRPDATAVVGNFRDAVRGNAG